MSSDQEQIRTDDKKVDDLTKEVRKLKDRCESYTSTIFALRGFILVIANNISSKSTSLNSSIGRKMTPLNQSNKREPYTPDLVIQLTPTSGIIGEVKALICENKDDRWNSYLEQVKKYDEDLEGWWTQDERISEVCQVFITELTNSAEIGDYLLKKINEDGNSLAHQFAVVEYGRLQRGREFLFFRKRGGDMPEVISSIFHEGVSFPLEELVTERDEKKFYDAKPADVEYIMAILWQDIFTQKVHERDQESVIYDENRKTFLLVVHLDELTQLLQRVYGSEGRKPREPEYPKKKWVEDALEKFVEIGLAEHTTDKNEFVIFYKDYKNPLEQIIKMTHKRKRKPSPPTQQLSFLD